MGKNLYAILFIAIFGVIFVTYYINQNNHKKDILENYIQIEAVIEKVGTTGRGIRFQSFLEILYNYNNKTNYKWIKRSYNKNYKIGDTINIYINKNNDEDIK